MALMEAAAGVPLQLSPPTTGSLPGGKFSPVWVGQGVTHLDQQLESHRSASPTEVILPVNMASHGYGSSSVCLGGKHLLPVPPASARREKDTSLWVLTLYD